MKGLVKVGLCVVAAAIGLLGDVSWACADSLIEANPAVVVVPVPAPGHSQSWKMSVRNRTSRILPISLSVSGSGGLLVNGPTPLTLTISEAGLDSAHEGGVGETTSASAPTSPRHAARSRSILPSCEETSRDCALDDENGESAMATTSGRVLVSDARLDAIGKLVLADLAPGERREFTATVSLPAAADDRYQGASGELSLKFVAVDASARVAGVPGAGSGASVWTGGRELNANAGFALAVGVLALAFAALLWLGSVLRRTKR